MSVQASWLADPDSELDYEWDWSTWLDSAGGETIASHTITAPTGITVVRESSTSTTVTVWLTGGAVGTRYKVVCHIVTSAGRADDRTINITVQDR